MKLRHGLHLAYCTNVHRGETWAETFAGLERYTLAVKERVSPKWPYAIGLRLSHRAALELKDTGRLGEFREWLEKHDCYVFTINGFPYGAFHGTRVKEQVYLPDWSASERVEYTKLLAEILAEILPAGVDGSISTVPCGFKPLVTTAGQHSEIRKNLWNAVEQLAKLEQETGRYIHLGLEPEPGCVLETTAETVELFAQLRAERKGDERLSRYLGVNYDACHLAVEFEEPRESLERLRASGIKLSKLHLSSALKVRASEAARKALQHFVEPVYLHQTIVRRADGSRAQYTDLDEALAREPQSRPSERDEWRIHFHVPLHSPGTELFGTTVEHLLGTMDWLKAHPGECTHLEMETYTWEVLPAELKSRSVVEQLAAEYDWTLKELRERGLG